VRRAGARSSGLPDKPLDTSTGIQSRVPPGTAAFITVCVFFAAIQELRPDWLALAERDPARFAAGEWWRIVTALFAYDDGPVQKLGIVFGALILGIVAERKIGSAEWLVIAFVSGLAGQIVGLWWQPVGAGASVAVAGMLGAVATWLVWPKTSRADGERGKPGAREKTLRWFAPGGSVVVLALAVGLVVMHDLHGPPIFVGAALAALFLRRSG
jgi:rhomboid protease GluP